jgi:nitrogenase molybdenum-iron protein alpha/beta subunit
LHFKFSDKIQKRILQLVDKKKINNLSTFENEELEKYLTYDLLIGLSKARAYKALHNL